MQLHHLKMKPIALMLACGLTVNHGALAAETAQQETCQGNWKSILTVAGGLLGALAGNQLGKGNGKLVATVAGGSLGGWLGNYIGGEIDRRHCELEKIAKANDLALSTDQVELKPNNLPPSIDESPSPNDTTSETSGNVDVATWHGLEHFASGSAELTPKAVEYFSAAARQYDAKTFAEAYLASAEREISQQGQPPLSKNDREMKLQELIAAQNLRPIVLVGYTDDTGDSLGNQQLSEKRARAVALVFKRQGIPSSRIFFRGAGETEPTADNRTEEGRASNRRVEIVELGSKNKLEHFMALKESNLKYYRTKNSTQEALPAADTRVKEDTLAQNTSATNAHNKSKEKAQASGDPRATVATATESASTDTHANNETTASKHTVRADATGIVASRNSVSGGESFGTPSSITPNSKANQNAAAKPDTPTLASSIDFGGGPFNGKMDVEVEKAMGKPLLPQKGIKDAIFSLSTIFVKEAQAADDRVYTVPCTADAPRYSGEYLSLETGQAVKVKTSNYAPGLYQTTWGAAINGNYVGVTPIAVLRDSFQPASAPTMYVYANTETPDSHTKPALKIPVAVNVYPGEKGILYRMFAKGKSGFVCSDVVFPRHAPFNALTGNLYYKRVGGSVYEANYVPAMLKL